MNFWLGRLGSVGIAMAAVLLLDFAVTGLNQDFTYRLFVLAGLYVTLSVSLNLINGITGQFSIGHAAFFMVGAYTSVMVTNAFYAAQPLGPQLWLPVAMLVGALGAAVAGLVVGLPSLRLKGDYLAIVTLGFGEILRIVVNNQNALGGSYGLNLKSDKMPALWLVALLAVICIATCRNLLKNAHGLPFLAVREDEVASSAMGVNVTTVKVAAFVLGSAFAGAAGALFGHFEGFFGPNNFTMDISFLILTMVVLGGTGSITGSTVAALLLFAIPEAPRFLLDGKGAPIQITGAMLLAMAIGLVGTVFLIKKVIDTDHGPAKARAGKIAMLTAGGLVTCIVLSFVFGLIPVLSAKTWDASALRMVILAVALILLMLLRPQGIFAHHEFSWKWLRGLFGQRQEAKA